MEYIVIVMNVKITFVYCLYILSCMSSVSKKIKKV